MKHRVVKKQENSAHCVVCGLENALGLHASFYILENGELAAVFTPRAEHQSYPGRLHGGMAAAILDETIGRSMMARDPENWTITLELNLKYHKPIPLDEAIRVVGRTTADNGRVCEGTGEILLPNGDVAASAVGKYLKKPLGKSTDAGMPLWRVSSADGDPEEIEL